MAQACLGASFVGRDSDTRRSPGKNEIWIWRRFCVLQLLSVSLFAVLSVSIQSVVVDDFHTLQVVVPSIFLIYFELPHHMTLKLMNFIPWAKFLFLNYSKLNFLWSLLTNGVASAELPKLVQELFPRRTRHHFWATFSSRTLQHDSKSIAQNKNKSNEQE